VAPKRTNPPETPETIELGEVVGPHGIRGGLRIKLHNRESRALEVGMHVHLVEGPKRRRAKISWLDYVPHKGLVRAIFEGVTTREAAENLRGTRVALRRDQLPPLDPDEFYLVDTVGRPVFRETPAGLQALGTVIDISTNGHQDLFDVEWVSPRGARKRWLMPVLPQFLVSMEAAQIVVDLPEGMLPDELECPTEGGQ